MELFIEKKTKTSFDFQYGVAAKKAVSLVFENKSLPDELEVNIIIVDPEEIKEINKENRNIDKVTDVLSFPYFEYEEPGIFDEELLEPGENILGDIIICGEKIKSQAEEFGHSQKREFCFLLVHSMLHLLGYDHIEPEDAKIMEAEQKRLMELLGIRR